jgi:hypothetical protein
LDALRCDPTTAFQDRMPFATAASRNSSLLFDLVEKVATGVALPENATYSVPTVTSVA